MGGGKGGVGNTKGGGVENLDQKDEKKVGEGKLQAITNICKWGPRCSRKWKMERHCWGSECQSGDPENAKKAKFIRLKRTGLLNEKGGKRGTENARPKNVERTQGWGGSG